MTINDEIIAIANQIANNGKKPSVALIKTKLSTPTSLPTIISALKSWTHEPTLIQVDNKPSDKITASPKSNDDISLIIQTALEPLYQEIRALKDTIEILSKKLK